MIAGMNKNPNKELLRLIKKWDLSKSEVSILCRCGRTSVYSWTRDTDHKDFFPMSNTHLHLLKLELSEASPYVTPAVAKARAKNKRIGNKMRKQVALPA